MSKGLGTGQPLCITTQWFFIGSLFRGRFLMRWGWEGLRNQAGKCRVFEGSGRKAEDLGPGPTGTGVGMDRVRAVLG